MRRPPGAANRRLRRRAAPDKAANVHPGTGGSGFRPEFNGFARLQLGASCSARAEWSRRCAYRGAKVAGNEENPRPAAGGIALASGEPEVARGPGERRRRAGCRWEWATGCGGASPAPRSAQALGAGRCAPGPDPGLPGHRPGWQRLRCGSVRGRRAWRSWGRKGLTSSPAVRRCRYPLGQVSQWIRAARGRKVAATSAA